MRRFSAIILAILLALCCYLVIYATFEQKLEKFRDEIRTNEKIQRKKEKKLEIMRVKLKNSRSKNRQILPTHSFPITTTTLPHIEYRSEGITVVTALFDIGRGNWYYYRRPYEYYLEYMENLLKLDVNMVIFIDNRGYDFVKKQRQKLKHKTKIIVTRKEQVPLWVMKDNVKAVLDFEKKNWKSSWEKSMKIHPEAMSAEYIIITNSKPYFMYKAAKENPFNSEFFCWFDAGYGHGNAHYFPPSGKWNPKNLVSGKITVVALHQKQNLDLITMDDLYRKDVSLISGGFFAGDKDSVIRHYQLYEPYVYDLSKKGYVDDDQTFLTLIIKEYKHLFNVVTGDWFEAFTLFH